MSQHYEAVLNIILFSYPIFVNKIMKYIEITTTVQNKESIKSYLILLPYFLTGIVLYKLISSQYFQTFLQEINWYIKNFCLQFTNNSETKTHNKLTNIARVKVFYLFKTIHYIFLLFLLVIPHLLTRILQGRADII